jgi:hypothetical protein
MRTLLLVLWVTFWIAVFGTAIAWLLRRAYRAEPLGVKGTFLIWALAPVRWTVEGVKRRRATRRPSGRT